MFNVHLGCTYRYLSSVIDSNQVTVKQAVGIRKVPHHILIVYSNLYCSGSLINSKIAVTAATCFVKYRGDAIVKVGSESLTGFGQIIPVQAVKVHEYFRHLSSLDNDIAMVVLKHHVTFGENVAKAVLIEPDVALYEGSMLRVSGWNRNNLSANFPNSLLLSDMYLTNRKVCQTIYGSLITNSNFCAKYNLDPRVQDNGGGAIYNDLLVGVLSYGSTKKWEPMMAIFTNISYFHLWLKVNTIKILNNYCHTSNKKYDSMGSDEYT